MVSETSCADVGRTSLAWSGHVRVTSRLSARCCAIRCRHPLGVFLAILLSTVLLSTLMFSSWNVCQQEYDDDVDVLTAASLSTRRRQRSTKRCLSPVTDAGLRLNVSLDSVDDLRTYNVSAIAARPYTSIIHVTWKTLEVPTRWKRSSESWLSKNENFVYCYWTDTDLEDFVSDEYPWLLSTYLAYPYVIQRCDMARYLLLYRYGGTYVDMDIVCRTPLSAIFLDAPLDAGLIVASTEPYGVSQEFMMVRRPRDPVIRSVISGLRRAAASWWYPPLPYAAVMFRTGPVYFTRRIYCNGNNAGVYVMPPSKYYGSYVLHVPGSSWHQWDGQLIWKVFLRLRPMNHRKNQVLLAVFSTAFLVFICVVRNRRFFSQLQPRFRPTRPLNIWPKRAKVNVTVRR